MKIRVAALVVLTLTIFGTLACKNDDVGKPTPTAPALPTVAAPSPTTPASSTAAASATPAAARTPGPVMTAPAQPPGVPPGLAVPPAVEEPQPSLGASSAIQGLYTYPSEGIPPQLRACAVNLATQQSTCTADHVMVTDHRGITGEGYRLVLQPGQYHAYVEYPGSMLRLAYYNEFVLCGFHVACQSHAKITLSVRAGVLINGVLLGDWYEPP